MAVCCVLPLHCGGSGVCSILKSCAGGGGGDGSYGMAMLKMYSSCFSSAVFPSPSCGMSLD